MVRTFTYNVYYFMLQTREDKCQRYIQTIARQARELNAHKKSLDEERAAKQLQQNEMLKRTSNFEAILKV